MSKKVEAISPKDDHVPPIVGGWKKAMATPA